MKTMINNSSCKSTKFVFNNCFSGQFHKMLLNDNKRVIPSPGNPDVAKICGVTSTTSDMPSVAQTHNIGVKEITTKQGKN